jgi:hypothetical protein
MRTYSTPESALNGEITKLAIVECVASAALYVGLGVYLGTFKYLAAAVVVAPLMLFRTDLSADWGLRLYSRIMYRYAIWTYQKVQADRLFLGLCASLTAPLIAPLTGTVIRVVSTSYWTVRMPLQTLRDTPRNWLRQCLCTDFAHPPEIIPKEAVSKNVRGVFTFTTYLALIREATVGSKIAYILLNFPLIILGWLPSVIYRVSFKATAVAYLPLVWVVDATLRNTLSVKTRLARIKKGELEKVRRKFSLVILAMLLAKFALVLSWVDKSYVESKFPSQKIVTDFVVLDGWPWWQFTLAADALLTYMLFFFSDAALARIKGQQVWREESVLTTVATASFLRAALAVVTISHFFYTALQTAAPESVRHLLS